MKILLRKLGIVSLALWAMSGAQAAPTGSPTIILVEPRSVIAGTAQLLTIAGSGFAPGAKVTFGGVTVSTTFLTTGVVTASVPAAANPVPASFPASEAITVVNLMGAASGVFSEPLMAPLPVIKSLSPSGCAQGASAIVAISGSNFGSDSVAYLNGTALVTKWTSTSALTVTVPASLTKSAGTDSVIVKTAGGTAMSNAAAFTVGSSSVSAR